MTTKQVYMISYALQSHLYLKKIGTNRYEWVDIFDADTYELEILAQNIVNTLKDKCVVVSVEVTK